MLPQGFLFLLVCKKGNQKLINCYIERLQEDTNQYVEIRQNQS